MTAQPTFPSLLEGFFTRRLMQQRQASAHTIASYRDTFRLLLHFAQKRLRKVPSTLVLEDIDVPLVVDFLDELEKGAPRDTEDAEPSSVRHPLVLPVRCLRSTCTCRTDPTRVSYPGQAVHARTGAV